MTDGEDLRPVGLRSDWCGDYRAGSKIYRALIEPGSGGPEFDRAVDDVIKLPR